MNGLKIKRGWFKDKAWTYSFSTIPPGGQFGVEIEKTNRGIPPIEPIGSRKDGFVLLSVISVVSLVALIVALVI